MSGSRGFVLKSDNFSNCPVFHDIPRASKLESPKGHIVVGVLPSEPFQVSGSCSCPLEAGQAGREKGAERFPVFSLLSLSRLGLNTAPEFRAKVAQSLPRPKKSALTLLTPGSMAARGQMFFIWSSHTRCRIKRSCASQN